MISVNHRPLGYEPSRINDSSAFQRLDAAGNDTKSLKRLQSTAIGPQSDHTLGSRLEAHGMQGPIGWLQTLWERHLGPRGSSDERERFRANWTNNPHSDRILRQAHIESERRWDR